MWIGRFITIPDLTSSSCCKQGKGTPPSALDQSPAQEQQPGMARLFPCLGGGSVGIQPIGLSDDHCGPAETTRLHMAEKHFIAPGDSNPR